MSAPADPRYVAARRVLLDALDALAAHRRALVIVGAQALQCSVSVLRNQSLKGCPLRTFARISPAGAVQMNGRGLSLLRSRPLVSQRFRGCGGVRVHGSGPRMVAETFCSRRSEESTTRWNWAVPVLTHRPTGRFCAWRHPRWSGWSPSTGRQR